MAAIVQNDTACRNCSNGVTDVSSSKDPLITLTVPSIMFGAGVLGNLLAILVLCKSSKEHKQTVFYRLVGALACTDLLGTCATSPVTLAVYANNLKWVGGMPLCNYESFMLIFAGFSTILIIGAMAVERYFSICHPFLYVKHMKVEKTKYVIVALWCFAIMMGCLPIIGLGKNVIQFPGTWCFFTFTSTTIKNKIFAYLYAIIGLVGISVTAISNFFVSGVLLKMRRRALDALRACAACSRRQEQEIQMMVLMIGIVAIFSMCWCPFLIRIIINQANHKQVNVKADLMTLRLASLNQILDPWIYILFRKQVFTSAWKFIRRVSHRSYRVMNHNNRKLSCISSEQGKENNIDTTADSLKNNLDENDVFIPEISATSSENREWTVKDKSKRKSSRSKSKQDERTALQQLMKQRNPECFGLKHPVCLFCFTNLPQAFALALGTENQIENNNTSGETNNEVPSPSECTL